MIGDYFVFEFKIVFMKVFNFIMKTKERERLEAVFSILHQIRSGRQADGFLCSKEHGKLCFEHPEKISGAQNNLPFAGGGKNLRSLFLC